MFGYIKPAADELKVKEYSFYRAVYCGLCRSLGHSVGYIAELTLDYDFVFLALLGLAFNGDEIKIEARRCAVHPLKKRPMLSVTPTLERVAKLSALLTYYKLRDDIADKRGARRIPSLLLLPAASSMKRRARIDERLEAETARLLGELDGLEKAGTPSPDPTADKFGELLANIFAAVTDDERSKRIASELGFHAGRWIYLIDALDDFERDKAKGEYNPFPEKPDKARAETALAYELISMERAVELMDFSDGGIESIVKNIIYLGMPARLERIFDLKKKAKTKESINDRPL